MLPPTRLRTIDRSPVSVRFHRKLSTTASNRRRCRSTVWSFAVKTLCVASGRPDTTALSDDNIVDYWHWPMRGAFEVVSVAAGLFKLVGLGRALSAKDSLQVCRWFYLASRAQIMLHVLDLSSDLVTYKTQRFH